MNWKILSCLSVLLAFASCSNDLEVVDEYKESMAVFALIQGDTTYRTTNQPPAPVTNYNYVRVNKVFLGPNDAAAMAQIGDSINPQNTTVQLIDGNNIVTATPDNSFSKQPGTFATDNYKVFRLANKVENKEYVLKVKNNKTGYEAKATVKPLSGVQLKNTLGSGISLNDISTKQPLDYRFMFNTGNASRFEIYIGMEIELIKNGTSTFKKFQLKLGELENPRGVEPYDYLYTFNTSRYFNYLFSQLSTDGTQHELQYIYITLIAADADYNLYKKLNGPSTGLAQNITNYTNVENGIGLVTRISTHIFQNDASSSTLEYLRDSGYNFCKPCN